MTEHGGGAPWLQRLLGDREDGTPATASSGPEPWRPQLPRPQGRDLIAAISIALVLIPQSLAYAVIAGFPPAAGLMVGIVATIAAAPFVSSPFLQTGPVAITALLAFGSLAGLAEPESAEWITLAALLALLVGVVRVIVGVTRTGPLAYVMSRPVLDGFTPAAAIVICVGQLPAALGIESPGRGPITVIPALVEVGAWNLAAAGVAVFAIAAVVIGRRLHPLVPGVLIAVVGGLVLAQTMGLDVATVGDIPATLPRPSLDLPLGSTASLVVPALLIALVGFAEPAAIARTYAQETRTRWDPDREFVSQGVANLASGLFGGFPVGGSFGRSAVNRAAGGVTPWSGLLTGVLVLAALPAMSLLSGLPKAVLAGVILAAVSSLIRFRPVLALRRWSRQQFVIAVATFVGTIVFAPQIQYGLLIGVVLSVGGHLRRELVVQLPNWTEGTSLHVRPLGVLYFGSAPVIEDRVAALLSDHPDVEHLVMHMDRVGRVDVTGALALESLCRRLQGVGIDTTVSELTPMGRRIVSRVMAENDPRIVLNNLDDLAAPLRHD